MRLALLPPMSKSSAQHPSRITVKNIAEKAGVSIGAVSSVLNNRHVERRISVDTVEKIREAAAKLGYLPNISARRLRSGGGKNVIALALITSFEAPIPLVNHFIFALGPGEATIVRAHNRHPCAGRHIVNRVAGAEHPALQRRRLGPLLPGHAAIIGGEQHFDTWSEFGAVMIRPGIPGDQSAGIEPQ